MTIKEEKELEKKTEDSEFKKINHKENQNYNFEKDNLIKLLEVQLKESEEKILEKKNTNEKEITLIQNRLNKEIQKCRKFSLEKLITEILPISDNVERALDLMRKKQLEENSKEITKKLQSVSDLLKEFFNLLNVKKIDNINISFNPTIHEAMSIHYTNEIESNQIVSVMQAGYILHESRLLRPAMVVVSKNKI